MTNPYDPYAAQGGLPDPERNRADWLRANPGAAPVDPGQAQRQVAAHLGAAAPAPGVTDAQLGAQAYAQGAHAGLPAEDDQDTQMAQMRAQFEDMVRRVEAMERERALERQAHIAALGEPILERYAAGVRDKLHTHRAMHPGMQDHLSRVTRTGDQLYDAAHKAIASGANDLSEVAGLASQVERFITKTHPRTGAGNASHIDFSSVLYDLELMLEEAAKLAPGVLALV